MKGEVVALRSWGSVLANGIKYIGTYATANGRVTSS